MKKELREELKNDLLAQESEGKSYLAKVVHNNKGIAIALGIASFAALAGYSAVKLLKHQNLAKKPI
jgi:hypothetical protein